MSLVDLFSMNWVAVDHAAVGVVFLVFFVMDGTQPRIILLFHDLHSKFLSVSSIFNTETRR